MPGYYPMPPRDHGPMMQMYPPSRSYSLAKLNVSRDYGIYDKVKVENRNRQNNKMFDKLRRQQSYDENMYPRMMYNAQPRRPEGFNSLQLLGAQNDDRYLDNFMENNRSRTLNRDMEKNSKNTLLSTKSKNSNNSNGSKDSNKKVNNKENKRKDKEGGGMSLSSIALALIGSMTNNSTADNIYESVEQIHYRKTIETLNRREKVRDIHRTGHPLFDHLREERALASGNTGAKRTSAGPSRKTSTISSPVHSSNSSGDEQEIRKVYRDEAVKRERMQSKVPPAKMRRAGSAGSESEDEWVIPRPKFGGRKRDSHIQSTDESDSSSKSIPMR